MPGLPKRDVFQTAHRRWDNLHLWGLPCRPEAMFRNSALPKLIQIFNFDAQIRFFRGWQELVPRWGSEQKVFRQGVEAKGSQARFLCKIRKVPGKSKALREDTLARFPSKGSSYVSECSAMSRFRSRSGSQKPDSPRTSQGHQFLPGSWTQAPRRQDNVSKTRFPTRSWPKVRWPKKQDLVTQGSLRQQCEESLRYGAWFPKAKVPNIRFPR